MLVYIEAHVYVPHVFDSLALTCCSCVLLLTLIGSIILVDVVILRFDWPADRSVIRSRYWEAGHELVCRCGFLQDGGAASKAVWRRVKN